MIDEPPLRPLLRLLAVVLFTLLGAMSAMLEILLVPLYIGGVIFPITLVIALIGNVGIPRALRFIVDSGGLAGLPLVAWIIVMFVAGFVPDSMGDVLLPGYGQGQYVSVALLLVGLVAGALAVALPPRRGRPARPSTKPPSTGRPTAASR